MLGLARCTSPQGFCFFCFFPAVMRWRMPPQSGQEKLWLKDYSGSHCKC